MSFETMLTPVVLSNKVQAIGTPPSVLRDVIFSQEETNPTNTIAFANSVGYVRNLPTIPKGSLAAPIKHMEGSVKTIEAPVIRVSLPINETVASKVFVGGSTFQGHMTDQNASLLQRIEFEMQKIKQSKEATLEYWLATLIQNGTLTLYDVDSNAISAIDYGYASGTGEDANIQPAKAGTSAWNSEKAKIRKDIDTLVRQIRRYSSYTGDLAILVGYDVTDALFSDPNVRTELDNTRMEIGGLSSDYQTYFKGRISGIPVFEVNGGIRSVTGSTVTDMWDSKTIAIVPTGATGEMAISYGAVWESVSGDQNNSMSDAQFIQTTWYAKAYHSHDPAGLNLIMETRPVPKIQDVRAIRVQKVIPDV